MLKDEMGNVCPAEFFFLMSLTHYTHYTHSTYSFTHNNATIMISMIEE